MNKSKFSFIFSYLDSRHKTMTSFAKWKICCNKHQFFENKGLKYVVNFTFCSNFFRSLLETKTFIHTNGQVKILPDRPSTHPVKWKIYTIAEVLIRNLCARQKIINEAQHYSTVHCCISRLTP